MQTFVKRREYDEFYNNSYPHYSYKRVLCSGLKKKKKMFVTESLQILSP